ncbi:unnamed protein product [Caenorhabditis bovis]|uniref:Uncharacterized protein n=1 Tax=Caenorhabditis bovis TaxID=2654633 RepID=A0A8S1FBS9_9PELO|nr:unnamed protein product [Caenorhabditis bovis]
MDKHSRRKNYTKNWLKIQKEVLLELNEETDANDVLKICEEQDNFCAKEIERFDEDDSSGCLNEVESEDKPKNNDENEPQMHQMSYKVEDIYDETGEYMK